MTDAAKVNPKRSYGVLWYVGGILFLYVASLIPVRLGMAWLLKNHIVDNDTFNFVASVHKPLVWLLGKLNLIDPLNRVMRWLRDLM
ncbi:MAG: hypothetical protein AB7O26_08475 [Planctomycetaceae bacterium]